MSLRTACTLLFAVCSLGAAAPIRAAGEKSPAQDRVDAARRAIEKEPTRPGPHNALALALARRARETGDASLYDEAQKAIDESLRLAPENYDALKTRVWLLLGKHEFSKALRAARELQRRAPDDVLVYGFLTDANVELGNYEDAEEAAQWMLDLRPGNVPGLTRGAYLRELFGDLDGALDFLATALHRTHPSEVEDRAWILTHMSHLKLEAGDVGAAEKVVNEALALFPHYHYALAQLAKVRGKQGRNADAVALLEQRYREASHPENLYDLACALRDAGRAAEADAAFSQFEKQALAESSGADNANRELAAYYVDQAKRPADGLRIAELEASRRKDVHTLAVLAGALQACGRSAEARETIAKAVAVGTKDKAIRARAAAILGDAAGAGSEEREKDGGGTD